MKNLFLFILAMLVALTGCKKSEEETLSAWTAEDQAFLDGIQSLQDKAADNYNLWVVSMDSLEMIANLQVLFQNDPKVSSVIVGRQGLAVQYTNGMRGGLFINPKRKSTSVTGNINRLVGTPKETNGSKSVVNKRKLFYFAPCHYQFEEYCNMNLESYSKCLPKVNFSMDAVYKNYDATLELLTQLGGFGIIHLDSHGWAWPDEPNLTEVYLQTWDILDEEKAKRYADDVKSGKICIPKAFTGDQSGWKDICMVSEKFISAHNDFSHDTVLFFGSFCYSFLGKWNQLPNYCAKGAYVGIDWTVRAGGSSGWASSLIDSLCNKTAKAPYTVESWYLGADPPKYYFEPDDNRNVSLHFAGDPNLALWKDSLRLETNVVQNITASTATSGGNVLSDGGFPVTMRGVCWGTNSNPSLSGSHTTDGGGNGAFTSSISGLEPNTLYYIRAYATNSSGTVYGNQLSFTTLAGSTIGEPCPGMPTITDPRDGKVYPTVQIGTQCWLQKNMNYQTGNSWCYDNNVSNCNVYGRLYDWSTALGVCPAGWHLPANTEWTTLIDFLGGKYSAGGKMKEAGTVHWLSPNTEGTNSSGFTALPGGYAETSTTFAHLPFRGYFWSSTPKDADLAWTLILSSNDAGADLMSGGYKIAGFSVRCIHD